MAAFVVSPPPVFPTGAFVEYGDTVVLHRDCCGWHRDRLADLAPARSVAGGLAAVVEIRLPSSTRPTQGKR